MKGYKKSIIRVGGIMPNDRIRIGDGMFRIREYKQLEYTRSTMLTLVPADDSSEKTILLTMDNDTNIAVYTKTE